MIVASDGPLEISPPLWGSDAVSGFGIHGCKAVLRSCRLFEPMTAVELDAAIARATLKRVPRGRAILHQGLPSPGIFVIAAGRVRVSVVSEDGKELMLDVLGAGDALGEMSLVDDQDCSANASAQDDCVLLFIERAHFQRMLRDNVDLCLRMLALLSGRVRQANANVMDMARLSLTTRLGRMLLRLARDYGERCAEGTRIKLRLSQRDLGTLVGSSREKVNKQLRRWEQDGILAKGGVWTVIVRSEALAGLS